jgi:L-amino acid N-acyltransferase YncA
MTQIRAMVAADWADVERIFLEGILSGQASFEVAPPAWDAFDLSKLEAHRLVAVDGTGRVVGWAAVSATSPRQAYSGVVEHSVYVAKEARGNGVGRALLEALIESTERGGIWTIKAVIFPENEASLALHDRLGFRRVGVRERIARATSGPREGLWQDTVLLERRRHND